MDARYQTAGEMADDLERVAARHARGAGRARESCSSSLFTPGPARTRRSHLVARGRATSGSGFVDPVQRDSRRTPPPPGEPCADPTKGAAVPRWRFDLGPDLGHRVARAAARAAASGWCWACSPWRRVGLRARDAPPVRAPRRERPPVAPAAAAAARVARAAFRLRRRPPQPAVEVSFDSSPQDAQVTREDSGEVVGRTPLTIPLPQRREVLSFRVEKDGYAPTVYKVIPDLTKAVRAELTALPWPRPSRRPPSSARRPSAPAHGHAPSPAAGVTTGRPARGGARTRPRRRCATVWCRSPRSPGPTSGSTARTPASGRPSSLPGQLRRPQAGPEAARSQGRARGTGHGGARPRAEAALRAERRVRRVTPRRRARVGGPARGQSWKARPMFRSAFAVNFDMPTSPSEARRPGPRCPRACTWKPKEGPKSTGPPATVSLQARRRSPEPHAIGRRWSP